jgi:hypothetical protein
VSRDSSYARFLLWPRLSCSACAGPARSRRQSASLRRHADLDKYSLRFNGHTARRIMDHELARDAPAAGVPPRSRQACCGRRRSVSEALWAVLPGAEVPRRLLDGCYLCESHSEGLIGERTACAHAWRAVGCPATLPRGRRADTDARARYPAAGAGVAPGLQGRPASGRAKGAGDPIINARKGAAGPGRAVRRVLVGHSLGAAGAAAEAIANPKVSGRRQGLRHLRGPAARWWHLACYWVVKRMPAFAPLLPLHPARPAYVCIRCQPLSRTSQGRRAPRRDAPRLADRERNIVAGIFPCQPG